MLDELKKLEKYSIIKWFYDLFRIIRDKTYKTVNKMKCVVRAFRESRNKNNAVESDYNIDENIKLYYWKYSDTSDNLGDYLSKIVVSFCSGVHEGKSSVSRTIYAIGSILGFRCQDAVVWGSGLLAENEIYLQKIRFSSLDIRAVRGPKTRELLVKLGKSCPEIYGDPAILMPRIFRPEKVEKRYEVSLILHYSDNTDVKGNENINIIDIITRDYENVIIQILQSSLVISSSLHGIILAEAYGIPAILLQNGSAQVPFKYKDWYYSTGRYDIVVASSVEEALGLRPMDIPELSEMQDRLLSAFPYDLWDVKG